MGQMRYGHSCWCASVLVQQYDIGQSSAVARADKLRKDSIASIQTDCRRHQQTNLFGEGSQSAGGRSRSGHEYTRLDNTGERSICWVLA